MRFHISIVFLLLLGFQSNAAISEYALVMDYSIDSVRANPDLPDGKSQVIVHVNNSDISEGETILYGYEEVSTEAILDSQKSFTFEFDAGGHILQFYPAQKSDYTEITSYGIKFEPRTVTYITLNFKIAVEMPVLMKKPVIYLYPEEKTAVSVVVNPKGEMSFTYPEYKDKWECTAYPSGEILINENSYNYLFWESNQNIKPQEVDRTEGIVVLKEDLVDFLENSLNSFGFTSQEKMDFITFWAPEMIKHSATEIRFMLNEDCALFADLEIDPKPNNLLRFYMIWSPTERINHNPESAITIPTQNRNGFTVLEWGGTEIEKRQQISN